MKSESSGPESARFCWPRWPVIVGAEVFTGSKVRQAISRRQRTGQPRQYRDSSAKRTTDGSIVSSFTFLQNVVLGTGLEPARLTAHAPQTCVSTNSTTRAFSTKEGGLRAIGRGLSSPEISCIHGLSRSGLRAGFCLRNGSFFSRQSPCRYRANLIIPASQPTCAAGLLPLTRARQAEKGRGISCRCRSGST